MTTPHDPIEDARAELARVAPPTPRELDTQRGRLEAAIAQSGAATRLRRRRIRWVPASGIAVAGLAAAALLATALAPSNDGSSENSDKPVRSGLQLVTGAGAFAGLDLDSASAADVLEAAGESAARGADGLAGKRWTYVRMESTSPNVTVGQDGPKVTVTSIDETWTDTKTGRKFAMSENSFPGRPAQVGVYYEHLEARTIGNVGWTANDGVTPGPRRANWHTSAGSGESSIEMHVELRRRLQDVRSVAEVTEVLDAVLDASGMTFRDGSGCLPRGGCMGFGGPVGVRPATLDEAESREMFGRGLLINVAAYEVVAPAATRAIYDYLAALSHVTVTALDDGSSNVELVFGHAGAPDGTGMRVVLDADTGRIVERGRAAHGGVTRWTAIGTTDEPMDGGTLCSAHRTECAELIDLQKRLETNPKARFNGVVDWMFISQFCDGMINRDGSTKQGDHLPRSMSKDPKVKAEREACEKREAAAARGD